MILKKCSLEWLVGLMRNMDLKILAREKGRDNLHQIMQGFGCQLQKVRNIEGKRGQEEELLPIFFSKHTKGMYLCVIRCMNKGSGNAIGVGKDEDGEDLIYDSGHEEALPLTQSLF
jgi:hypothetical protein